MQGQINWAELFFSSTGRLARTPFVVAAGALVGFGLLYEISVPNTLHWLTGWFIYPAMLYVGACLLSKRLHDRGRSGWLAGLILIALTAIWAPPTNAFDFVFLLVLVWTVVELGLLSGEQGANRFGPNPGRVAQA
jgi:uncharacterized membrane protein YhaH (DUF805 family)